MNLLRDVCTAVGVLVLVANVLFLWVVATGEIVRQVRRWADGQKISGLDGTARGSGGDVEAGLLSVPPGHAPGVGRRSVGTARKASQTSGASQRPELRAVPTHPARRGGAA